MIYNSFALIVEYLRMASVAIFSHKLRSFLTTLGIFIGVTTIITIWTTIQGLNNYINSTLSEIGSSVVYVEKFPWIIQDDFWKYRNRKNITWNEFEAIEKFSTLADYVTPQLVSRKTIGFKENKFENVAVLGTTNNFIETSNVTPGEGRFLTELDIRNKVPVCVLGAELASKLFEEKNPVGERIKIDGLKYRVVGILEKQGDFFGQSQDNYAVVPIGTFRNAFGRHRGLQIAVLTENPDNIEDMKEELRGILRKARKVKPGDEDNFSINEQNQLTGFYEQTTSTLYAIIIVIGAISLLVGGIGITNIMLVSVTERTKEIGLRKAVGAKRRNVLSQFLLESVAIASIGGFIGIAAGIIVGSIILNMMTVEGGVAFSSIAVGFLFSTFVGVVSGFYPAYKAANMNPIDSLRYE
jgi:putative ABC transport system permease protein